MTSKHSFGPVRKCSQMRPRHAARRRAAAAGRKDRLLRGGILATALTEGRDLTEIGLMREVARRTIEAHFDSERMWP